MRVRELLSDLWLAFGVLGFLIGLAAPVVMLAYVLYAMLV